MAQSCLRRPVPACTLRTGLTSPSLQAHSLATQSGQGGDAEGGWPNGPHLKTNFVPLCLSVTMWLARKSDRHAGGGNLGWLGNPAGFWHPILRRKEVVTAFGNKGKSFLSFFGWIPKKNFFSFYLANNRVYR